MTRVLHLITRFLDGGAEKTTVNGIDALQQSDIDYDIRLGTGPDHDPERLAGLDVETVVFASLRHYNPVALLAAVGAVWWYLHREDIDVLHTHSTEAGIVGRLAGALAGTPVVIHEIHGDPITADRSPLFNRVLLTLEQVAATLSTVLIAKSERIRETYLQRGIGHDNQYELIYHGVDVDRFKEANQHSWLADDSTTLLFVGRLADGKGLDDLLTALERQESSDVELLVAGTGPKQAALEADADARGLPVSFLGYREDIPQLLAGADALVLPSYREGTPRVITESLAAGTPVISTRIAGIPEQVDHNKTGNLIEPGDVDALASLIAGVEADPERWEQMGERGQAQLEAFREETAAESYRHLYAQLREEYLTRRGHD